MSNPPRRSRSPLALLGLCVLASCLEPSYSLIVKNVGGEVASDISISYPGFSFRFGSIAPGVETSNMSVRAALPPAMSISWRRPSGETVTQEVAIEPAPPPHFDGLICIQISHSRARAFPALRTYNSCTAVLQGK